MSASNRFELEHTLVARAFRDPAFASFLHGDPKAAVESHLGAPLPAGTQVKLLLEDAQHLYIVLPHQDHTFAGALAAPTGLGSHTRKHIEGTRLCNLLSNPELMKQFLADPTSAIRKEVGLPPGTTVEVVHEVPGTLTILIPYHGRSMY